MSTSKPNDFTHVLLGETAGSPAPMFFRMCAKGRGYRGTRLSVTKRGGAQHTARPSAGCHGGAKMAILAYSLGKREINHYFSIKNAKLLSLVAVILLTVFHAVSRHYGGEYLIALNAAVLASSLRRRATFST